MFDVLIIGAGVVGGMVARNLSRYKLKVCIADKENDVACGATKANSAIVHAGFDAACGSLKAKLNVRGAALMEQTCKELGVKYKRNGALVLGFSDQDRQMLCELYQRGTQNGVQGLELLERNALSQLEPQLAEHVLCGLHAPSSAITCPYALTVAAIGNAMDNGVQLKLNFKVQSIQKAENGYTVCSDTEQIRTRYIVNAAGLFSDQIAAMAGDTSFTVHPRKGEYMLLDKAWGGKLTRTLFRTPTDKGKGVLVTPTVDGNLLLGPTAVDDTDKSHTATTDTGLNKVKAEAATYIQNIPFGKVITSFCGNRAAGDTGDFIIKPYNGMVQLGGIESPGLSAAPAIAEHVTNMLQDMGLVLQQNTSFNPNRKPMDWFRHTSQEEKNKVIAQNPAYGKMVCRCEQVTEGEIVEAIRQNPPATDLDGVKRRTRAQMGRCQGGFCVPYVTEILARELHIPYERVTKNGNNSILCTGKTKEVEA